MGCDRTVTARTLGALVSIALLLTGCVRGTTDDASAAPAEGAVADDVLFAQVADLPGVADVEDLRFQQDFGLPPQYAGRITAADDANPLCVLDEALSILHQGREGVGLEVLVTTSAKKTYGLSSLVGRDGSAEDRYGPQPTEPRPTATVRPCTPPAEGSSLGGSTPAPTP